MPLIILVLSIFFLGWNTKVLANSTETSKVRVDLFISTTCPHCHKAIEWFDSISKANPWIEIKTSAINEDKAALETYYQRLKAMNASGFVVPAMFFCGYRWVGFDNPEQSGKKIYRALKYCHDNMDSNGRVNPKANALLKQWSDASFVDLQLQIGGDGFLMNLITMSLVDATSICSLFFIFAFIAAMIREDTVRKSMLTGVILIAVICVIHIFQPIYQTIPGAIVAIFMIFALFFSIRREIYLLLLAIFSAMILMIQQSCHTARTGANGVWLSDQKASVFIHILYEIIYLLPMILVFSGLLLLMRTAFFKKYALNFYQAGTLTLCVIALCLIIKPGVLANYSLSQWLPLVTVSGFILAKPLSIFFRRESGNGH